MLAVCLLIVAIRVALRKESVDRNEYIQAGTGILNVALRKESVDRNNPFETFIILSKQSLSARRAWIEMFSAMYAL